MLFTIIVVSGLMTSACDKGQRGELLGDWVMVTGLPCERAEYHYFKDGTFLIQFNENNLSGKYEIVRSERRNKVVWNFSGDDKKRNCSGKDWGLVGRSLSLFFKVVDGSPDKLNYYSNDSETSPSSIFVRETPTKVEEPNKAFKGDVARATHP